MMIAMVFALRILVLCSVANGLRPLGHGIRLVNNINRPVKEQDGDLSHRLNVDWDPRALTIRGGATEVDQSLGESSFLSNIQNFIEKCIDSLEGRSPTIAGYLRKCFSALESITGLALLPKPRKEKGSKKKKKKKTKVKSDTQQERTKGPEKDTEEDKASVKSKKKSAAKTTSKTKTASESTSKKRSSKSSGSSSKKQSSSLATAHVQKDLKANSPNYRIQRELKAFLTDPPPNLKVKVGNNLRVWIVTMKGAKNTIYEGETFRLRIAFPAQYPTVPPSVYFLPPDIPVHEHVYTNGDICLSLLGKDWRPTMTAQSIAVSILSILSSAQSKSLPMDNARHAQNKPGEYQKDWVYHDDNC